MHGIITQNSRNTVPDWDFVRSGSNYVKDDYSLYE
jgi:hypothetical protein